MVTGSSAAVSSNLDDGTGLTDIDLLIEAFDLFFDNGANLFCLDLHNYSLVNTRCMALSRPRIVLSTTVLPRRI